MIGPHQTVIEHERFEADCGIFDIRVSECARVCVSSSSSQTLLISFCVIAAH